MKHRKPPASLSEKHRHEGGRGTLLVLAAGPLQLPAIRVAQRIGLRVIAIDGNAAAPGLALADCAYVADIQDTTTCLEIATREQIDGVVHICSEVAMHTMGRINEVLGLHGIDLATATRATDKGKMRRAFETAGAPSPRSIDISSEDEGFAAAGFVGWPLIVKPSRSSGSRGVTRIEDNGKPAHLRLAIQRALEESRDHRAVIEKFVEGPEFSVEILVWNQEPHVVAVTDKLTTGSPYFVEIGHSQPTLYDGSDRELIERAAIMGVRALGIDWAAAHAEVRLSPEGPFLMEIGARLGGDFITTELVPRSTGIDMVEGAIRLALGEEPDLVPRHPPQGVSIRYLMPEPGVITEITGLVQARQMDGIKIVEVAVGLGDTVPKVTSSLARVGHVIAEGKTVADAIIRAEDARDAIRIHTES
jgi:biotin carboxylase